MANTRLDNRIKRERFCKCGAALGVIGEATFMLFGGLCSWCEDEAGEQRLNDGVNRILKEEFGS